MHGSRTEVGGRGGAGGPFGLTLKITSSIGNKQLSSTPILVGPPLEPKSTVFFAIDS